ncbi:MAG: chitobiase/beta-hexosaminidase C-terminal domain-containing protein [Bacteroidales bacterium]|nr:chitobiase/beta-hexosaminidase C-terminal domain-containing protein [Bacteroidales bacterium]
MIKIKSGSFCLAIILQIILSALISSQAFSSSDYMAVSRYDYYTSEETVEFIVWVPESKSGLSVNIDMVFEYDHLAKGENVVAGQMNIFSFPLEKFHLGSNEITVSYNENGKWVDSDKVELIIRADQYNAVKIDRVSGGLIVEGLPFFPFGFYNYSPVQPGLAEEEVVQGFNMMSPYQKIEGKTLKERKAYMDRCAALGMKVNYNLLSLAGGGGVASKKYDKLSRSKRIKMLRKEIETFRDHPALLSWYISDEPVGQGVPPDSLLYAYELLKELDPYHPITVVFMSPWMAKDYSHVMDIVMADPYPIPHSSVDEVGVTAAMLHAEFFLRKPVWIVPQAFGGNEWWLREPTKQELRVMTYLGIVNKAMGIQYFIRHGLNSFPKSTIAWNECAAISLEIAELTPFLFSADPVPDISCEEINVQLKAYHKDGAFVIIVVNTINKPLEYSFSLDGMVYSGSAGLMFEDRRVDVNKGHVEDIINAFGTRVYKIKYKMGIYKGPKLHYKNIIKDPSFEDITATGVPASCYARPQNDRGATYFIDSRTSVRGNHSLRLTTPTSNEGMSLSFYRLRIEPGQSYTMSVQAKAIPLKFREKTHKCFFKRLCGCGPDEEDYPEFTISFGTKCEESFIPDGEWNEYSFNCVPLPEYGANQLSPVLKLNGKGTAWFDLLQLYPDMQITSSVSKENNNIMLNITTIHQDADIYYSLDGSEPGSASEKHTRNIVLSKPSTLRAAAYKDGIRVGYIEKYFEVNKATGRYVDYKYKYSTKYHADYNNGLVDGILASSDFKDGKWQGFEGEDFNVEINLGKVKHISEIELHFLQDKTSWIYLPTEIKILWSANGKDFYEIEHNIRQGIDYKDPHIYKYNVKISGIEARYFRIIAGNIGVCPEGHPGTGGKAWLFTDEIIIR